MADRPAPVVVENHDEAYHVWRRAGAVGRTVVHIDAHHDMAWLDGTDRVTIGNYVCQAIKDGIVREVVWVVPDASWSTPRNRSVLRRHLKTLAREYPGTRPFIRETDRLISTQLSGVPITVCALDTLPGFAEPVLLDVDTDFLILHAVEYSDDDRPRALPWMWPEDLVASLERKELTAEIVTIAYSVTGGYTPLKWKYLADALSLAWTIGAAPSRAQYGFQLLREAALADASGDRTSAVTAVRRAADGLSASAAPYYHLALLHLKARDRAEAQRCFGLAIQIDPSYRSPHSSRGFVCLNEGRQSEAAREFESVLVLDPGNPFARLGLGRISVLDSRWTDAEADLRGAIGVAPRLVDAHRYLGDTLVKLGRDAEAAEAYARSLKLALEGEVSIEESIHTMVTDDAPRDEQHGRIHAALARIDARAGRLASAMSGYRMAIAAGSDLAPVRAELAWMCVRHGRWADAAQEAGQALRLMPRAMARWTRRLTRWVQRKRPSQR